MELKDLEEKYQELEAEKATLEARQKAILLEEEVLSELIEVMRQAKIKYQDGMSEVETEIAHPLTEFFIIRRSLCPNRDFKTKYPELQKRNRVLADVCQQSGIRFTVREELDYSDNHKRRLIITQYAIPAHMLGKSLPIKAQIL